jgi:hypothetical protein
MSLIRVLLVAILGRTIIASMRGVAVEAFFQTKARFFAIGDA